MLSPDDTHVFVVIAERAVGVKPTIVPNYVTETGYTEDIPARSNVGDSQERRLLAVLNIKTGKTAWADGSFAPAASQPTSEKPPIPPETPASERPARPSGRTRHPVVDAGRLRRRQVCDCDGSFCGQQGSLARGPRPRIRQARGSSTCCTTMRGCAKRVGGGIAAPAVEFLPDGKRIWFLSERDGWMHLYTLDVSVESAKADAADVGQMGSGVGGGGARRQEVLHHDQRSPSWRAASLPASDRGWSANEDHVDGRLESGGDLAGRIDAGPGLFLQQQAARSVRDAEHGRGRRPSRSRRRRPRPGDRSSGSIRRSSPSRRGTALMSTRGSSRQR